MECNFVVGQRVQCVVDASEGWVVNKHYPHILTPQGGHIYTIRNIEVFTPLPTEPATEHGIGLRFMEFINPVVEFAFGRRTEPAFEYVYFRPLNERPTSIEAFKKLERPNKPKLVRPKELAQ